MSEIYKRLFSGVVLIDALGDALGHVRALTLEQIRGDFLED
jgi:hypothetical protein